MAVMQRLLFIGIGLTILIASLCSGTICRIYLTTIEIDAGFDEVVEAMAPDLGSAGFELLGSSDGRAAWWRQRNGLAIYVSREDGWVRVRLTGRQPGFEEVRRFLEKSLASHLGEERVTILGFWARLRGQGR